METLPSVPSRPIPRRAHTKSKTGCRTCKIRKVKCDESRPLCLNCKRLYLDIVSCDFDDQEIVVAAAVPVRSDRSTRKEANVSEVIASSSRPTGTLQSRLWQTAPKPRGREAEPLPMPQAVSQGRIDPFEMRTPSQLPATVVEELLSHYLTEFAFRSFPFYTSKSLIEVWWYFVRGDKVLFHVVLLVTAIDRENLDNRSTTVIRTRRLLDECLILLSARIEDPMEGVNDPTVGAIAMVAAMEYDRANMRAASTHLIGLKSAVDLRGGLGSISSENNLAANMVFWCAFLAVNEPDIVPVTYSAAGHSDSWVDDIEKTTLLTHDGGEKNLLDFGVDITTANILHEVQRLSQLYATTLSSGTAQEAGMVLSELCRGLERLLQLSKSTFNGSPIPGLSQSCRIAGVLHVFAPMSAYFPNPTLMLQALTRDIKASLTLLICAVDARSQLLLWLLSVGGLTAHSMLERSWFVGHLVVVVTELGVTTWKEYRGYLAQLAFHDNFCDIMFNALWEEVRLKQDALAMSLRYAMSAEVVR